MEVFYDGKAELAEGPFFEPETNQLLWVDFYSSTMNFLNVDSRKNRLVYNCMLSLADSMSV